MPAAEPLSPAARGEHTRKALSGLRWIGSARIITQGLTWAMTLFTVRLLQPHDYGLVATAGLFTLFANLLLDGGLSIALVSERSFSARQCGAALVWVLAMSLALAAIVAALAPAAAAFFRTPELTRLLRVAALQLPLWGLLVVPTALLGRQLRFRESALSQMIGGLIQGVATLAMAYSGAAYWSLIVGTMIGTAARGAAQWLFLPERPTPNLHFAALRPLWRTCAQMLGQRIVYFFTGDFDTLMLGRLAGPAALGSYSLAKTLAQTAVDQLAGVVNQVSVPVFANKGGDPGAQIAGLMTLVSTVSVLVFPLFWFMGVLSQVGLPLLLGARWTSLVWPFVAFTLIMPLRSLYMLLDSAVVGSGRVSTSFRNMLTWTVIMVPLLLVAARFGANAAASTWVVGFPLVFWLSMRRIARVFATRTAALLRPTLVPLACTAASCALIELTAPLAQQRLAPLGQLSVELAVASVCYWALLRYGARRQYEQFLRLSLQLLGRRSPA